MKKVIAGMLMTLCFAAPILADEGEELAKKLASVSRQRLDVPSLPLRIDRVECERRLARAGESGEHDQLVTREFEIDVLQVVLSSTLYEDLLTRHWSSS